MHEAALSSAALPAPTLVLGLLLEPYSLGHELFLIRENNPILTGERLPTMPDLAGAALICCQGYEANRRMYRDRLLPLKLWLWRLRNRRAQFLPELACFRGYMAAGRQEMPLSPMVKKQGDGRAPGAPFLLRIHQFLTTKLGLTQEAAWDFPYGFAVMQWEAFYESEGGLNIQNGPETSHLEYVDKMEKEAQCQA